MRFQSQGRFSGGSNYILAPSFIEVDSFNRRGDSLGGATSTLGVRRLYHRMFQSQGRFSGGSNAGFEDLTPGRQVFQSQGRFSGGSNSAPGCPHSPLSGVSIAGAILWGEQLATGDGQVSSRCGFNRRGDSLGGATYNRAWVNDDGQEFQSQGRFSGGSNAQNR